ncbi:MAG: nucleotidyltransferase family protein [Lachnospiraceae bacterium]|nr:nucleotidyltransferase family protein [Lachnospiraceae bacterium]
MDRIHPGKVKLFFEQLNNAPIRYLLVKNIDDYLPDNLYAGQDIDIMVHPEDRECLQALLADEGFERNIHLEKSRTTGYTLEGEMDETHCFQKEGMIIDVCYQLYVNGLQRGSVFSLHQDIQKDIWEKRQWNAEKGWYQLDEENLLAYCIARCVFDKKSFPLGYLTEIEKRSGLLEKESVQKKLYTVFSDFTPNLFGLLETKQYENIREAYVNNWYSGLQKGKNGNPGAGGLEKLFAKAPFFTAEELLQLPAEFLGKINVMLPDLRSAQREEVELGSLLIREKNVLRIPHYVQIRKSRALLKNRESDLPKDSTDMMIVFNNQTIIREGVQSAVRKYRKCGECKVSVVHFYFKDNKYNMSKQPRWFFG